MGLFFTRESNLYGKNKCLFLEWVNIFLFKLIHRFRVFICQKSQNIFNILKIYNTSSREIRNHKIDTNNDKTKIEEKYNKSPLKNHISHSTNRPTKEYFYYIPLLLR